MIVFTQLPIRSLVRNHVILCVGQIADVAAADAVAAAAGFDLITFE